MKHLLLLLLTLAGSAAAAADLIHTYTFSRGLGDSVGIVDLEGHGGFVAAGRYRFEPNQGLTLRDGLSNVNSYSVEMALSLDESSSYYIKLLDYAGLSIDNGVYVAGEDLVYYPYTSVGNRPVLPNTDFVYVFVRDADGTTRGYIDGQLQFTVFAPDDAVPSDNVLNFMRDDLYTSQQEATSGAIDYLRVYNGALGSVDVANLAPPVANILGDTITGHLSNGISDINFWQTDTAIVTSPGAEFDDVITSLNEYEADFDGDRLTLTQTGNTSVSLANWIVTLDDLDYETDITGLAVISNTFSNGPVITQTTANSITVTTPGGFIAAGQQFQVIFQVLTRDVDDADGDGVDAPMDNCLTVANPTQIDTDNDGFGNACDADLNNDCVVNAPDLGALRAAFFSAPGDAAWNGDADFNGDNVVNALDLGTLRGAFFGAPGPSGVVLCE